MLSVIRPAKHIATSLRAGVSRSARDRAVGSVSTYTLLPRWHEPGIRRFGRSVKRWQETKAEGALGELVQNAALVEHDNFAFAKTLPVVCPGCGALSQTIEPESPGFYSRKKRNVKTTQKSDEDKIFQEAMARIESLEQHQPAQQETEQEPESNRANLICDRCHDLIYQSKGSSILHPSMQSIQDIIESSPHKHNHIYHVLDAADFPMSLIPNLMSALKLPRLRTQNRRSKSIQYARDRVADISFIITRCDLLAPKKEQVDRLMPYMQEVLRDALGRTGRNVRLGNVRCVSAKRGWWTPQVKEEIWKRGGAGWVVGKVNVGKSALFEVVFPKGRNFDAVETARTTALGTSNASHEQIEGVANSAKFTPFNDEGLAQINSALSEDATEDQGVVDEGETAQRQQTPEEDDELDDDSDLMLLPPAQPETQYPQMPIVSSLPGTTASPIRIPFGNGKGELIDLPGVQRSSLETHVAPEHRSSLVMKSRIVPEQYSLKPGQSLLIGGIVRITPKTDELVFLAYPFTPLHPHATGNHKAVAIQTGVNEDGTPYTGTVENIGTDTAKTRIKSAGTYTLEWDVTKRRAGPVTDKQAGKQKAENLPFVVYGADILIEGVGWVELVCQVRNRRKSLISDALGVEFGTTDQPVNAKPQVEVFTPKGKFIGIRRPMNAWLDGGPKKVAKHARKSRPRMTISMQRRKEGGKKGGQAANAVLS
ncbi:hypothetical protein M409DRAFT_20242 [Zasmidium cellare ATCC 36951]|uniref:G domain-containing protein n=1 Tax=Zasmidium cellare ATCC 36951 TaxID=1080233 RepID=A0A6A6CUH1_ZASCE|nr:uncharacterized protein M409DRAFT_20242 [Zasmidium cellare ATCC 36951]KAF2169828.1 hypothetical protein M409DRAFT_20242 [Zasmidium cellare ATCC 36951]